MSALDLSLMLVTDTALCGERGVPAVVAEAVAGGVTIVQVREKHAEDRTVLALVEQIAAAIDGRATLILNDRLDIAIKARERGFRIDGVHLGQSDASVERARAELGPDAVVGLTANRPEHFAAVARLPRGTVDYCGVGVVRPTTTKPNHPEPLGVDGWARLTAPVDLPCVAIGGIVASDAGPLRAAGAAGVAVVSAICAAPDPRAAAQAFVRAWSGEPAEAIR